VFLDGNNKYHYISDRLFYLQLSNHLHALATINQKNKSTLYSMHNNNLGDTQGDYISGKGRRPKQKKWPATI